jgi:hypothetical protein
MGIYIRLLVTMLLIGCQSASLLGQEITLMVGGEPVLLRRNPQSLSVHFKKLTTLPTVSSKQATPVASVMEPGRTLSWTALTWEDTDKPIDAETALAAAGIAMDQVDRVSWGWQTEEGTTFWFDRRITYRAKPNTTPQALQSLLAAYPGAIASQTPTGLPYLEVARPEDLLPLNQALYASGLVHWCQPEFRTQASSNTVRQVASPSQITGPECPPSDPNYADQYYLNNTVTSLNPTANYPYFSPSLAGTDINVLEAWCLSKGNSSTVVAIVDEGVEAHEDLEDGLGNSRLIGGYYTDTTYSGQGGPVNDGDAHGQAVAGIVAASHNNLGGSGIAPAVKLLSVWIDKGSSGTDLQRADGIRWAYQQGADIILNAWTFSYCSGFPSQVLEDAIDSAQVYGRGGLGALVIFSSGFVFEDNPTLTCVRYPANLPNVLTVGAMGPGGDVYPQQRTGSGPTNALPPNYAPYGPQIDLVGVSGYDRSNSFVSAMDRMGDLGYNASTVTYLEYPSPNYTLYFGGTSTASAQVAGIAALMLDINSTLNQADLMSILTATARDVGPVGVDSRFGAGIADAYAAVQSAQTTLPVEWGRFGGIVAGERVRLDWQTLQEVNNDRFVIERNTGNGFAAIGEQLGQGTTSGVTSYQFFDDSPQAGRNVYRLQQIDFDGRSDYSNQVEVRFLPAEADLSVLSPNPARGQVHFEVYGQQRQAVYVDLIDLHGRTLRSQKTLVDTEVHACSLSLVGLTPGLYFVQVRNDDVLLGTRRLVVQP